MYFCIKQGGTKFTKFNIINNKIHKKIRVTWILFMAVVGRKLTKQGQS